MFHLQLNPYHELLAFRTVKQNSECPFQVGDKVRIRLLFGLPIPVTADRQTEEDLRNINARWEVVLTPYGQEVTNADYIWCEVVWSGKPSSRRVMFLNDKDRVLRAVLTDQDTGFPFRPFQIITAQLAVERVQLMTHRHEEDWTWNAVLGPSGQEVNGLVIAEVDLAE